MSLPRLISFLVILLALLPASVQSKETSPIGIAVFNMAWAGTIDNFKRHVEVCSAAGVNWCDTRARISRGAQNATPEEEARARRCLDATIAAAGSFDEAMMIAPCNAYGTRKNPGRVETEENYNVKLDGLRATVENLIQNKKMRIIPFQEVKSQEIIEHVLGKFVEQFNVCVAPHTTFQTVAFAWDKTISSGAYGCVPNPDLAITEQPKDDEDEAFSHRVRPGLSLELVVNGSPVTFLNIHLKSGCANLKTSGGFPGRKMTDPHANCIMLNRQIPILEDWVDYVARESPRFVLLGDFNRRIDEEAKAAVSETEVRADGTDPAGPNTKDDLGRVNSNYLWQEIADGVPPMHQVPLTSTERGCTGFKGLDHIVISDPVKLAQAGVLESGKIAVVKKKRQPIATSDHCPRITILEL
ncbi:hypothetical protein [Nitrosospira briensis]|uniref:hypothetical protein n=1 Tax=Nitrosospira briensis TaxID=35799 RepID=UPI0008DFE4D7|nr:hypothetical protein [Nitrosospira briensis]SFO11061.1 Endonuclease/Exonuclease/phosphatase family protein [Nitrosospira briensis]